MNKLKKSLYFLVAGYFRFFARFVLERWQPQVIVITGSNGKTTLLHLVEAQLKDQAVYSHKANSAFGVPFHILGLERKTLEKTEWIKLILLAPLKVFRKLPEQTIYIVEADCDRPREGKFLAKLLRPEITLWVSSNRTHSMNFDRLVSEGKFSDVESAIAYEFGWFLQETTKLAIIKDDPLMLVQKSRTNASVKTISLGQIKSYKLSKSSSIFESKKGNKYKTNAILPKQAFIQLGMAHMLCKYLKLKFDQNFSGYNQPPGRSSVFSGKNGLTLFDSSYNSNLASMSAALEAFESYPAKAKWAVISDMIEQGEGEKLEHEKLARLLAKQKFEQIILMGPRVKKYTKPALRKLVSDKVTLVAFDKPKPVLDYLVKEAKNKTVFFKGARWLEGVIKNLLENPEDTHKLCRRETHYQKIREKWGVG